MSGMCYGCCPKMFFPLDMIWITLTRIVPYDISTISFSLRLSEKLENKEKKGREKK